MLDFVPWVFLLAVPLPLSVLKYKVAKAHAENIAEINKIIRDSKKPIPERKAGECKCLKPHHPVDFLSFLPISFSVFFIYSCVKTLVSLSEHSGDYRNAYLVQMQVQSACLAIIYLLFLLIFAGQYSSVVRLTKQFDYKAIVGEKPTILDFLAMYFTPTWEWALLCLPIMLLKA